MQDRLTDLPDSLTDPLSHLLKLLRLDGALFLEARFTAPWNVLSACPGALVAAGAGHVVFFHIVTKGRCAVRLAGGGQVIELSAGDLILIAHNEVHLIGSDLQLAPVDVATLPLQRAPGGLMRMEHGGGGEQTRLMCGYLSCDPLLSRPLLDALPRLLRVPLGHGPAAQWLLALVERGALENSAPGPGSGTMLAKLAELLFVEAMRYHLDSLPEAEVSWLAGLRDRHVGRALALLHESPMHEWNVELLAERTGVSRSVLTQRFAELIGLPPMQYLKRWRLGLAAAALEDNRMPIATLAGQYGYESEASFNRAFKQMYGAPPAAWRRRRAAA